MITFVWLLLGGLLGAVYVWFAITRTANSQRIFAVGLMVAALIYVGLALLNPAARPYLPLELVGFGIYTVAAILSWRGSRWWLVAGWGLHPVWDLLVHYAATTGAEVVVPYWYAVACLSFDIIVAFAIAQRTPNFTRKVFT